MKGIEVGETIKVHYQAASVLTGKTVKMDVFDETDTLDAGQSGVMTVIGTTRNYQKSFVPDAQGNWRAECYAITTTNVRSGQVTEAYVVGSFNIDTVGATVADVEAKIDAIAATMEDQDSPPMIG
jgi:hypothetical protein